ncbi:MAG: CCA tRNA nucleotidyltransferase, partial [Clostridia bacterium]|nr:CCA tRNA nucleotidyltransferase [Clostridia bacterium]
WKCVNKEVRAMLNFIDKSAQRAIRMLEKSGYQAGLVGGCVRDMLMGIPPHDFDITTNATPEKMKFVFQKERVIETGIKHGTLTVIIDGTPLEITTFRIDGEYKDSRHPESVTFSRNLKSDLERRDFTVNALYYDLDEGVVDAFDGENDIKNKVIRAVGDPEKRFCEDALRILRAIRFSSVLGFEIEEKTRQAMLKCKHLLKNISAERIAVEINKFVLGKNVKNAILQNYEILGELCPEFIKMHGFNQHNNWHIYDVLEHTAVAVESTPPLMHLRLSMLFHDTGKVHTFFRDEKGIGHFYGHGEKSAEIVREYLNKYKYDNETKEKVYYLVKHHDLYTEEDEVLIKKRLNRMGKERFLELVQIQRADNLAQNPALTKMEHFDILEEMARDISLRSCFDLKSLAINGSDLVENGFERGAKIGEILNTLLQEVIENKLKNERNILLSRAQSLKQ